MKSGDEIIFKAEIDELDPRPPVEQVRAELPLYTNGEDSNELPYLGNINYSKEFIPVRGLFPGARFHGSLSFSSERQGTARKSAKDIAVAEFQTELGNLLAEEVYLYLLDISDGENHGLLLLRKSLLPEWLAEEGDTGYVVVELAYDHDRTRTQTGRTDEELAERRATYREKFADWEETEF